jgi:translation initiation factor IF-2
LAKQMRVHILAKELGVTSKAILDKCHAEGLDLKNHMAVLSAGLEATIREWFSEGTHETVVEEADRVDLEVVRKKVIRKRAIKDGDEEAELAEGMTTAVAEGPAPPHEGAEEPTAVAEGADVAAEGPAEAPPVQEVVAEAPVPASEGLVGGHEPTASEAGATGVEVPAIPEGETVPGADVPETDEAEGAPRAAAEVPSEVAEPAVAKPEPERIVPAGPQLTRPAPAILQGPQVVRMSTPEPDRRPVPRSPGRGSYMSPNVIPERGVVGGGKRRGKKEDGTTDTEDGPKVGKVAKHRLNPRRTTESVEAEQRIREFRDRDLLEREERLKAAGERSGLRRRAADTKAGIRPALRPKAESVVLQEPITLKNFCAEVGVGFSRLFPKLTALGKMARITDTIDQETARVLAAEFNVEVTVLEARSLLDELKAEFESRVPTKLVPRPPVVTLLGHVDHGKTSLLDAIRKSRLVDREAGGITQQIGAYRYHEGNIDVTFIDTPGHEAFTAMRSRGANMTDVVVLVVAADDGVMPTTREAIKHARAADVPIVVALNKIDLPGVDLNRIYGQLAEENLTPSEWGGETDVIKTSAVSGEGIQSLLEHLTTLTDLLELRADPDADASGWIIEAEETKGEGIVATILVTHGTLRAGSIVVAGPSHGRIRSLHDDRGRALREVTPGTPVRVSGLDVVPVTGERFYQVDDVRRAKQIAEQQQSRMRSASLAEVSKPKTLDEIFKQRQAGEVPELNVILRADTHGKLETLRAELSRFPDSEVRLRILLDGIGAVTESDVTLASTSNAIVIGFWVVAEEGARRMAQDLGVDVRLYRVIYEVTDDIRKALEGLLEPEHKEEYKGRLDVRQVFNISRVGTVAGCYVSDGVIARSHRVRLIRDGAVIRDNCEIGSLKRVKDDAREVRAGFECGVKISSFDDIHAGDVIESYEIIDVARTLS